MYSKSNVPVGTEEASSQKNTTKLESKVYNFQVEGSMPVLEFEISAGSIASETPSGLATESDRSEHQHLRLELYNPRSGEVFEAKFPKGRIEVDNDGSITYFSTSTDSLNMSVFLGRNITLRLQKSGKVEITSPSKIRELQVDDTSSKLQKKKNKKNGGAVPGTSLGSEVTSSYLSFTLD